MKRLSLAALAVGVAVLLWASVANAASVLFPTGGGTGTSTAPGYGKVLVGNRSGRFDYVATSSIGGIASYFTATSSTATSTFAGAFTSPNINGVLVVDGLTFARTQAGIQSAINTCSSLATLGLCGEVYLPSGTYNTTSTIHLKSNVLLRGAGMGNTVIKGAATTYTLIDTVRTGTSKTVYTHIGIRDLTIVSQSDAILEINNTDGLSISGVEEYYTVTTPISEPFNVQYGQNVSITNNYLHDLTGNGIQMNGVDHFTVANNRVNGVQVIDKDCIDIDTDFQLTKTITSNFGTVTGNDISNCVNSIRVENGSNIVVANNTINGATDSGVYLNTSDGLSLSNVTVAGNNISSTSFTGISAVSGGVGETTQNILIYGNVISDAGRIGGSNIRAGINVAAASTTVSNNYVFNSGGNDANGGAIVDYKLSNVVIIDNTIASSSRGVNLWNGSCAITYTNVTVRGNSMNSVATPYSNDCGVLSQAGISISGTSFSAAGIPSYGIGTSSPGTAFSVGNIANFSAATSTFSSTGGINLKSGCFAVNGTCITSGTSPSGSLGQIGYFSGANTLVGTSTLTIGTDQTVSVSSSNTGLIGSLLSISDASTIAGNQTVNITSARGGGVQAVRIGMSGGGNALALAQTGDGTALNIAASSTATGLQLNSNGTLFPTLLMDLQKSGTSKFTVGVNGTGYFASSVGIGTTTPWALLSVNPSGISGAAFAVGSSTATKFVVSNSGLVGVGMTAPTVALDVSGMLHASAIGSVPAGSAGIRLYSYANDTQMGMGRPNSAQYAEFIFDTNGTRDWTLGTRASDSGLHFYDQTTTKSSLYLKPGGNVGVGTTSPGVLMDLYSTASTTLRVDTNTTTKGGQLIVKDASGGTYTCVYTQGGTVFSKVAASPTTC